MSARRFSVTGRVVDVLRGRVFGARVEVAAGCIRRVVPVAKARGPFLMPGFVDAHVHVESSMLTPPEFARAAVVHGTVAAVSDPHEIANVLGEAGVQFMLDTARRTPFHFCFGAPSCVPATPFETAGAVLDAEAVGRLLERPDIGYLAEMMNFPGVLNGDAEVMRKIAFARRVGKPVDGHAPGLTGEDARRYASAGISTDHECLSPAEAEDKIRAGMKILLRHGSAASGFETMVPLIDRHPEACMFCSDDKHPDDLVRSHIDGMVRTAMAAGCDPMKVLRVAGLNAVRHYGLAVGLLREGDCADFIVVDDWEEPLARQTYVRGELVAENGSSLLPQVRLRPVNQFHAHRVRAADVVVPVRARRRLRVIAAEENSLVTGAQTVSPTVAGRAVVADPARDLLKLVVVNRYRPAPPAVTFVTGFGLKRGALATSVAHDSHNLIAVGTSDDAIVRALNAVIAHRGGLAVVEGRHAKILPLPVAGLMSTASYRTVARDYAAMDAAAHALGSTWKAPFMTLSFLSLPVIPHLKLTDRGLFDVDRFAFTDLWA